MEKKIKVQETRERLLSAGLEVFSSRGYDGATVREISDAAGCNLASVNYYFGDKAGCYQAVREHARRIRREIMQRCWEHIERDPWEALRIHIDILLDHTYNSTMSRINWMHLRDLIDNKESPVQGLNPDHEQQIQLYEKRMTELLSALLGPAASEANISLIRYTYHSLCLFLPIQTQAEQRFFKGKSRFRLSDSHDKTYLTDYILNIVRHAVTDMQAEQSSPDRKVNT